MRVKFSMRGKMKKLFQKRTVIIFSVAFFLAAVSIPVAFAQDLQLANSSQEIQFVQNLSSVLQNGTIEQALSLFESIPENLKNDTELLCLKGSLLLSSGKTEQAEKIASSLFEKEQKNIEVLNLNFMVAKQKGDKVNKSKFIKQILAIEPYNAEANIELADEQSLKKNWRNARDYYKKALFGDRTNEEALLGYGKMCYYMEKDDDAKDAFNRLYKLNPNNPQVNSYLGKYEAENTQYKKAIEYIKTAIKIDPSNTDYWFDLGTWSRMTGDYSGAESAWKQAITLEPEYFLGYAYLAGLYDEQGRNEDALSYYRLTVEKNPQYYYAYESLGILAWGAGSWEESQKAFEQALKKNPDSISYKLMITACLFKQKKNLELRTFTEALMKKLTNRQSLDYKIVRMYHDRGGDSDVALNISKETNRTKKGRYLFYLALYYELMGKDSLAQKYYNEVTAMQSPMFFEYRLAQWASGIK